MDRKEPVARDFGCPVFENFEEALDLFSPSALVLPTPPETHVFFLTEALRRGIHAFSELNLVEDGHDEILPFEEQDSPVAFLSSTILYRGENRWIAENHEMTGERKFGSSPFRLGCIPEPRIPQLHLGVEVTYNIFRAYPFG